MFEYYRYKLANKPMEKIKAEMKAQSDLGMKGWGLSLILGVICSCLIVFAPGGGFFVFLGIFISVALIFGYLVLQTGVPFRELALKVMQLLVLLLSTIFLMGLLLIGTSLMIHQMMRHTHHMGQILMTVDVIIRGLVVMVLPLLIILTFRLLKGYPILVKIHRKHYFELLVILAVGLLMGQLSTLMVVRSLPLTTIIQFLFLTTINTLTLTAVIMSIRNREVLR